MKILNIKINSFGKLQNKEIELKDNINIIYGKNESGKSTMLKFILGMFYGLSKNKNGKFTSDYERYLPWNKDEFSGKITYELDNKEEFQIFREFKKKNPKIYNSNLEDISKQFDIDKNNGNQFFYEQTKVDEELFLSTIVSEQEQVKLNEKTQNTLVQKMANLVGTGDDNISFNKIIAKLNKKQLEEVGTLRSQDRPINIVTEKLEEIEKEQKCLQEYTNKKYQIEETKQQYKKEIKEQEQELEILNKLRQIKEKEEIEKQKIQVNEKIEKDYDEKMKEINAQLEQIENKNDSKTRNTKFTKLSLTIICILLIIALILFIYVNKVASIIVLLSTITYFTIQSYKQYMNKMLIKQTQKQQDVEKAKLKNEISIIENTKNNQKTQLEKMKNELNYNIKLELQKLKLEYQVLSNDIDELYKKDIKKDIDKLINYINESKLKLQLLELDKQNVITKLEDLAQIEETKEELKTRFQELEFNNNSINLAKQEIQKAYEEMKQNITPKFTKDLSKIISNISNSKYNNVKFDEENGIIVEIENGDYITANHLSIGTIDQLYLALRLSSASQISQEKLPIILDEAFAYYDDERLKNIFTFLNKQYKDRQIIIFSCTNREKETLDNLNLRYNFVTMDS